MAEVVVRDAVPEDVPAIADIQNALLATTAIEWTDEPHTVAERQAWFDRQRGRDFPVLVADDGGHVVGFTSYSDFRDTTRWPGYRHTVELTIHVRRSHWRGGVATALLQALIDRARASGRHALIAGVEASNEPSLALHRKLGFVEVGRLPQVGAKLGRWLDLVLLQLLLDDRPAPPSS